MPPVRSISVNLNVKSEKVGQCPLHFSAVYWPKGDKVAFVRQSMTHPLTVNQPSAYPFSGGLTNQVQVPGPAGATKATSQLAPATTSEDGDSNGSCSADESGLGTNFGGDAALPDLLPSVIRQGSTRLLRPSGP